MNPLTTIHIVMTRWPDGERALMVPTAHGQQPVILLSDAGADLDEVLKGLREKLAADPDCSGKHLTIARFSGREDVAEIDRSGERPAHPRAVGDPFRT